MKYLILASLIAVLLLCAAQGAKGQDSIWYPYKSLNGTIYGKPMPHQFAVDLLVWWDEWVDSCWADSTLQTYYPRHCNADPCTHLVSIPSTTRWTHRNPDFPGFMDFIRRRTK